ncbi:hypothetical protein PVAND_015813 [Polypedilum vanderplanki]|uniref:Ion transport domain-containing protein n=1 Tax=Polypedilum vanderplanki TaxID=319348 RepID=A0A9J6BDB5_POLVA|nr:hypothetical protein PVAND_015813 [Polypedilum vanderplanki]
MENVVVEVNITLNDIQENYNEYFKYKRRIDDHIKTHHKDSKTLQPIDFIIPSNNSPSEFENILISNDDKSATITLILRDLNLWCNETFWLSQVNLDRVMKHYANDENASIKNLFSILTHDWCEPRETGDNGSHFLVQKFDAFDQNCGDGKTLFERLCEIANTQFQYSNVIMQIIFCYIRGILIKKDNTIMGKKFLENIDFALKIDRYETKVRILKILMQIVTKEIVNDEKYKEIKESIVDLMKHDIKFETIYKRSIKDINRIYNKNYFDLCFLLVEQQMDEFKEKFEELLIMTKEFYGEFWKISISHEIRMLLNATHNDCLPTVHEFITQKCKFVYSVDNFVIQKDIVFNEPLSDHEKKILTTTYSLLPTFKRKDEKLKKKFIDHLENLNMKLLFGRKNHHEKNVIEEIILNPEFRDLLSKIWEKFQLWDDPTVLVAENPLQKSLIDYVLDTKSDDQLLKLLEIPSSTSETKIAKKQNRYTMMFNAQMCAHPNYKMCFIEHYINTFIEKKHFVIAGFGGNLLYYLEEVNVIEIKSKDPIIESLINPRKELFDDKFLLTEIDRTLRFLMMNWKGEGKFYEDYKAEIRKQLESYDILFYMIEEKYELFFKYFELTRRELIDAYKRRYGKAWNDVLDKHFFFDIFYLAVRKEQKNIIDFILERDPFEEIVEAYFPENIDITDMHYYTANKLMEETNKIHIENFPQRWFTLDVLKKFLDSRVVVFNEDYTEMDLSFMLGKEIDSLNYLKYLGSLYSEEILLHPVIETYVDLKSNKYSRIYQWNYFAFMLLFIIPFIPLMIFNHIESDVGGWIHLKHLHYISIGFLVIRETFQLASQDKKIDYFKQKSNHYEIFLILVAIALSVCSSLFNKKSDDQLIALKVLEIFFIFMTTVSASTLNFLTKDPIYVKILKKITVIFLHIMQVFILIICGMAFSIYIVLKGNSSEDESENGSSNNVTTNGDENEGNSYLKAPVSSLLRVLTFLSGEYSLENDKMTLFQLIFGLLFVIASFILFNLIVGISFDHIESIMEESRQLNVLDKIKKLIQMEEKFLANQTYTKRSCLKAIFNYFYMQYRHIQDLKKIYIEMKTKKVYVRFDGERHEVLELTKSKSFHKYEIDVKIFEGIQKILLKEEEKRLEKLSSLSSTLEIKKE